MPMTANDLQRIAGSLSGPNGVVNTTDLINYGDTVIVAPGASTDEGVPLTGEAVKDALGEDFQVFPLAVEYGPSVGQALEVFGNVDTDDDLAELESELDTLPDATGDAYGISERRLERVTKRVRKRYMRIVGRFQKCQALLQGGRGYIHPANLAAPFMVLVRAIQGKEKRLEKRAKRCDRLYRRLLKVWQKIGRKGIDRSGLPSPEKVKRQMVRGAGVVSSRRGRQYTVRRGRERVVYVPVPMQAPQRRAPLPYQYPQYQPGGYVPTSKTVSPYYLADQAAMERELQSVMPSYMGNQRELHDDLRAEVMGFAFSDLEHDYYGVAGSPPEAEYGDDGDLEDGLSDEDLVLLDDDEDVLWGMESEAEEIGVADDDSDLLGAEDEEIVIEEADDELGYDLGEDDLLGDAADEALEAADEDLEEAEAALGPAGPPRTTEKEAMRLLRMRRRLDTKRIALLRSLKEGRWRRAKRKEQRVLRQVAAIESEIKAIDARVQAARAAQGDEDVVGRLRSRGRAYRAGLRRGTRRGRRMARRGRVRRAYRKGLRRLPAPALRAAGRGVEALRERGEQARETFVERPQEAAQQAREAVEELPARLAARLNRERSRLARRVQSLLASGASEYDQSVKEVQARIEEIDRWLGGGSRNNGVDYGRLQPKSDDAPGAPVIVIAIRKRPSETETIKGAAAYYGASEGLYIPRPDLIDVYSVGLNRIETGYAAPRAMSMIQAHTHPEDWLHGEDEDAVGAPRARRRQPWRGSGEPPFPLGGAPPLPPPRRIGSEVLG